MIDNRRVAQLMPERYGDKALEEMSLELMSRIRELSAALYQRLTGHLAKADVKDLAAPKYLKLRSSQCPTYSQAHSRDRTRRRSWPPPVTLDRNRRLHAGSDR